MDDIIEREYCEGGKPVLKVRISLPAASGTGVKRISNNYKKLEKRFVSHAEGSLLPAAKKEMALAEEENRRFLPFTLDVTHSVTDDTMELFSLYIDVRERTLSHRPLLLRYADTWDTRTGALLELSDFMSSKRLRRHVIEQVREQMDARIDSGEHMYYRINDRLLSRQFNRDNFYIDQGRVAVFFQPLSIAPRMEGVPLFYL